MPVLFFTHTHTNECGYRDQVRGGRSQTQRAEDTDYLDTCVRVRVHRDGRREDHQETSNLPLFGLEKVYLV